MFVEVTSTQVNRPEYTEFAMVDPPKRKDAQSSGSQEHAMGDRPMQNIAKETSPKIDYLDITAMIRSLQRTEGYKDCFRTGISDCDQIKCAWRQYCLHNYESRPAKDRC